MSSLCVWRIVVILYQTIICVIFSWLTLQCRLEPRPDEARQLTLIKLLYLYEPQTCGRLFFYNHTNANKAISFSTIVWPESNNIAASFREKIKLLLSLHVVWLTLALLHISQGRRECGFYAVLLPLTATGAALLVVDLAHTTLFLKDAMITANETQILKYIGRTSTVHRIKKVVPYKEEFRVLTREDDTTWIPLFFAYVSCRGVVQWIVNFWVVLDTYLEGLETYRNLAPMKRESKKKSLTK